MHDPLVGLVLTPLAARRARAHRRANIVPKLSKRFTWINSISDGSLRLGEPTR